MRSIGLLVIDVQERLFPACDRPDQVAKQMVKMIEGAKLLGIPIKVTEQYPEGLGHTIPYLKEVLPEEEVFEKTRFSGAAAAGEEEEWILIGLEAHVCVLQTAKELLEMGKKPIILNDAVSSRSIFDFSTGIMEARDCGVRVSCVESLLFELMEDARHPHFKAMQALVK